jgi:ribosomal-protein-alanine N-acetyltransferase
MIKPFPARLSTARLVCERLGAEHDPELRILLSDPRVARTLSPTGEPLSQAEASANLRDKIDHWTRMGFGMWLLRDRVTGEPVGRGGLQCTFASGRDEVEVGWAIVPERWGEGLATELALASVHAGLEHLRLSELIAFTLPSNIASLRVMQKAGFRFDAEIVHVGLAHLLYRRRRAESIEKEEGSDRWSAPEPVEGS